MSVRSQRFQRIRYNAIYAFTILMLLSILSLIAVESARANEMGSIKVEKIFQSPTEPPAGDAVLITLIPKAKAKKITGTFYNKKVVFFKKDKKSNTFYALLATDVNAKEKSVNLKYAIDFLSGVTAGFEYDVKVKSVEYPEEKLTVAKKMVEPPKEVSSRIKAEQELVQKIYKDIKGVPLFNTEFVMPLNTKISSTYGKRRILNGIKKSPHSGIDMKGNIGKPVKATNSGTVVLAQALYFSGNTVIVDHGLGLFSLYFHLDKTTKSVGEDVEKGDTIGTVGMTGRATGPHLHFSFKLNGLFVNPLSVISLAKDMYQPDGVVANDDAKK